MPVVRVLTLAKRYNLFDFSVQIEGDLHAPSSQVLGRLRGTLTLDVEIGYVIRVPDPSSGLSLALLHHFYLAVKPGRRLPCVSFTGQCTSGPMTGATITARRVSLNDLESPGQGACLSVGEAVIDVSSAGRYGSSELYFLNLVGEALAYSASATAGGPILSGPPYPSVPLSLAGTTAPGILYSLVKGSRDQLRQCLRKNPFMPASVLECVLRPRMSVYSRGLRQASSLLSLFQGSRVTPLASVERDETGGILRMHCRTPNHAYFETAFQLIPSASAEPNPLDRFLALCSPNWSTANERYGIDVALDYLLRSIEIPVSEIRFLLVCIGFEKIASAMAKSLNVPRDGKGKKSFKWLLLEAFDQVGLRQEVTFIDWRNDVIHTGDFPCGSRDGFRYYKETLGKLQLFALRALGYRGPYYDVRRGWALRMLA